MLEERIIHTLATELGLDAPELQRRTTDAQGKKYSIQGVYKELRKLQKEGAVFKLGKKYSLRLPWVLQRVEETSRMAATYVERPQLATLLPGESGKEKWHFTDLLKMNDFWSHLLLVLIQQSKKKTLLGYNPHPWFHLVQTEQEEQYVHALKRAHSKLFLIVGGNTFLDRWAEKFWDRDVVEYSFAESSFHSERTAYLNVVDDYLITVKIDIDTSHAIDAIYEKTRSMDDLDLQSVLKIFQQKTNCSIWLEKNPEKTKKIKTRFKKYWGIDF